MAESYFLTGHPGVGKTTAIKKILDGLGRKSCGGMSSGPGSTPGGCILTSRRL